MRGSGALNSSHLVTVGRRLRGAHTWVELTSRAARCGSEAKDALFCWQKCSPGSSEDVGSGLSFWFYRGAERRPRERVHLHVHTSGPCERELMRSQESHQKESVGSLFIALTSAGWWSYVIADRIGSDWTLDLCSLWALGPRPRYA